MTIRPDQAAVDRRWMAAALALGRRGIGSTAPNPSVGCVIVDPTVGDGRLICQGWTQPGGRPHAEAMALSCAEPEALRAATVYVTLEPCAHHGKTGPCADALVNAGVRRVVYAVGDPDPRVDGRGRALLEQAGVSVLSGVLAAEAKQDLVGHLLRVQRRRPHVTLKLASSLDGRIAMASGESQWITGPEARARAHWLRVEADVILVGAGAALTDDPLLTCRLPGLEHRSPVRVVADSNLRLPLNSQLAMTAPEPPLWLLHAPTVSGAPNAQADQLMGMGVDLIETPRDASGKLDLTVALRQLADRGVTRVLSEGGGQLAASLLRAGLVDRLIWAAAGVTIGAEGRPSIADLGLAGLGDAQRWTLVESALVGADVWMEWRKASEN